ncbi:hypothetical protein GGR56DRAFT_542598 [Xylariaceae sp. FL0804]|nr:hypothetical protein GGR56DRAFT_542598 [Xylariaceae sp. FL0804]
MDYPRDTFGRNPMPPLALVNGGSEHPHYFLEPEHPMGAKVLPSRQANDIVFYPADSFGDLSRYYRVPRGLTKKEGNFEFVYMRRNTGTIDHGLQRPNSDEFERAKMNPLLHPRRDHYNNPNYAPGANLETPCQGRDLAVLDMVNYPYIPNIVMRGHHQIHFPALARPRAKQSDNLEAVFNVPELTAKIFSHIWDESETLSYLFRTCQFMALKIQEFPTYWDMSLATLLHPTSGDPVDWQLTPFLTLAPVRGPYRATPASLANLRNAYGHPLHNGGRVIKPGLNIWMANNMRALLEMHRASRTLMHVQIVANCMFEETTLQAMLDAMPRLKTLSILRCPLLSLGHTDVVLDKVIDFNRQRANRSQDEAPLRIDFEPHYFKGPKQNRVGEYGSIDMDLGTLRTTKGVVAYLMRVWDMCSENNIELFKPGKGFRHFLDRLPFQLGSLPAILEAFANIHDFYNHVHHAYVEDNYLPVRYMDGPESPPVICSEMYDEMERTVWTDLLVAMKGSAMQNEELTSALVFRGKVLLQLCRGCNIAMPCVFFRADVLREDEQFWRCFGCNLQDYCYDTSAGLRQERSKLVRRALSTSFSDDDEREVMSIHELVALDSQYSEKQEAKANWRHMESDFHIRVRKMARRARNLEADTVQKVQWTFHGWHARIRELDDANREGFQGQRIGAAKENRDEKAGLEQRFCRLASKFDDRQLPIANEVALS